MQLKQVVLIQAGVTMVEIIMAFTIMAMALIPVFSMLQSGSQKSTFSDYYIFAHVRAAQLMEIKAALPFEELVNQSNLGISVDSEVFNDLERPKEYDIRNQNYSEEWSFEVLDTESGLGILTVTITWKFKKLEDEREYILKRLVRKKTASLTQKFNLE